MFWNFFERMNFASSILEVDLIEAKDFPGMSCSPDTVGFLSIYDICQGNNWTPTRYEFTYEDGPSDRCVFATLEIKTHVADSSMGKKFLLRETHEILILVSHGTSLA